MKKTLVLFFTLLLSLFFIQACGSGEQEAQQVAQQQRMEQQRADERARARADSLARVEEQRRVAEQRERERIDREMRDFRFAENGALTVQVDSWQTLELAEAGLQRWKERGFDNAYLSEFVNDESGDVWYRLRIGRFASPRMAERLQYVLLQDFEQASWIDNYRGGEQSGSVRVREQ